jgi:hypothetical protein
MSKEFEANNAYPSEVEGTHYRVVGFHYKFKIGDIIELVENNGTCFPWFKNSDGDKRSVCWDRLERLPTYN